MPNVNYFQQVAIIYKNQNPGRNFLCSNISRLQGSRPKKNVRFTSLLENISWTGTLNNKTKEMRGHPIIFHAESTCQKY